LRGLFHPFLLKGPTMTQTQVNRAVARVTGESVETIQGRGFTFYPAIPRRCSRRRRRGIRRRAKLGGKTLRS
jgi:hypothetical protein